MSKLNKLIQTLCPNGVPFVELGTIAKGEKERNKGEQCNLAFSITKGGLVKTSDYFKDATVTSEDTSGYKIVRKNWFVYSPSRIDVGSINYLRDEETVIVSPLNVVFSISEDKILPQYLLYFLQSRSGTWQILTKREGIEGTGRKLLPFERFSTIILPLPPIEIQREVVKILDNFENLISELTAELTARKKQYEYYRKRLLTFDNSVPLKTINDVCSKVSSGGTPSTSHSEYYNGTIPWLRTQEVDWRDIYDTDVKITQQGMDNSSAKYVPQNCVIVAMYGATAAKVAINKIPLTTNQACCNLEIDSEQANYRYVFYWLCSEYENLKALGQGSQSNINAGIVKSYPIPVPSLDIQNEIVNLLDKFDVLCSDRTCGLPAEIEARQKQYEHYRDKLLTFKEVGKC